jgi:hypothetical protein
MSIKAIFLIFVLLQTEMIEHFSFMPRFTCGVMTLIKGPVLVKGVLLMLSALRNKVCNHSSTSAAGVNPDSKSQQKQPALSTQDSVGLTEDCFTRQTTQTPVILSRKEILGQRMALLTEMDKLQKHNASRFHRWSEAVEARYQEAKQEDAYLKKCQKNPNLQTEQPFTLDVAQIDRAVEQNRPKSKADLKAEDTQRVRESHQRLRMHRAGLLPPAREEAQPLPPNEQTEPNAPYSVDDELTARLKALKEETANSVVDDGTADLVARLAALRQS